MKTIKYSIPKQIANHIEHEITMGNLKVGDKIPTEPELVNYYGASRNTVREAVQSLIHAGILEARQGSGTYVIANERLQVDFFNLMNKIKKEDIIEVRTLMEEHIVESAVIHSTEEDIQNIEQHLIERSNTFDAIKENTEADINFHISIAFATHNTLLIKIYQYVSQFFFEFISSSVSAHQEQQDYMDILHRDLVTAIKNRQSEKAKQIINKIINL